MEFAAGRLERQQAGGFEFGQQAVRSLARARDQAAHPRQRQRMPPQAVGHSGHLVLRNLGALDEFAQQGGGFRPGQFFIQANRVVRRSLGLPAGQHQPRVFRRQHRQEGLQLGFFSGLLRPFHHDERPPPAARRQGAFVRGRNRQRFGGKRGGQVVPGFGRFSG